MLRAPARHEGEVSKMADRDSIGSGERRTRKEESRRGREHPEKGLLPAPVNISWRCFATGAKSSRSGSRISRIKVGFSRALPPRKPKRTLFTRRSTAGSESLRTSRMLRGGRASEWAQCEGLRHADTRMRTRWWTRERATRVRVWDIATVRARQRALWQTSARVRENRRCECA